MDNTAKEKIIGMCNYVAKTVKAFVAMDRTCKKETKVFCVALWGEGQYQNQLADNVGGGVYFHVPQLYLDYLSYIN